MKIVDTYYTTLTQIPTKNGERKFNRFENLGEVLEHCDKVPFNVHTIKKITVYETFFGNFKIEKKVLAE